MIREIIVRFTFDWEGYEDVDDELLIEDLGFRIEDGVLWEILKNDQPYTAEDMRQAFNAGMTKGIKLQMAVANGVEIEPSFDDWMKEFKEEQE